MQYGLILPEVVISGTPTISGGAGEFILDSKITLNTQPANGEVWRVKINTKEITDGIFAVPGEGVTLDASRFASTMDGYDVKQNAKGELLLCNHQTAYAAVSNEDGSTHKMLCCCRETTVEESVACSGFGATCQTKAVCAACGQSYGETNPDVHTFNDDGKCVCGAERDAATTVDLSLLTATYVISDSGEYIFTGSGSYGIKVESGNPKIVLNNVNISLTDGDYYENNPINGIHIATTGGTTEILVLGESSITAKAGAGIFVAEGGTVKITGSSREDILIATGASGCSGIGGYVYQTNGSVNCGNIEISNVTVKAFGSDSSMGDSTPAIGGAGNGNCGYITIDNADVYAEGFINPYGYEGSSAIGTGVGWGNREGGTIGEISIINDSKVYVTRGNYCDYIGCCGHENAPAEGVVDATAKSSTIYCYDTTDTTEPVQTLKYGALGGLLKEDGTCEGEHTGIICDNCGYCSCTHEGVEPTYALTEDGSRHTATWSCCGYEVTEEHSWNCEPDEANTNKMTFSCTIDGCTKGGTITVTGPEGAIYDGNNHTATVTVETKENEELIETPVITYDSLTEGVELVDGKPVNAGTYQANVSFEGVLSYQEFEIKKATPNIGTVSAESMKNTLDISNVVLSRTDGTISGTLSLKEGTELAYGTNDYTYVFKSGDANYNDVEGTVSITISDTNAPTATYKVGTDGWKQFINTITFGHFCKGYTTVDIIYSDEGSGVADKQYYISEEEITNTENIQWSDYTDILNINATGKYYIYVRVTDNYGNVVIQNSKGIVVYAESVITPTSFSCEYGEEHDLCVNISTNGNAFANLTDGSGNEIDTENYSIDGSRLIIKGEYLSDLDVGKYTYKICMNPQGVETTEVTLAYSFVVNVTAKELTVTGATVASRDYIANDKTVDITGVTLSGKQGTDDVSVEITGLKGTLSSANAGDYTEVTLPALKLTGKDKDNYVLTQPSKAVPTNVTISPQATGTAQNVTKKYLFSQENADTINLVSLLPKDCGTVVSYGTPDVTENVTYKVAPSIKEGTLTYTVSKGSLEIVGHKGTIKIDVQTQNYASVPITIYVQVVAQIPVTAQTEVTLKEDGQKLTYGQKLSALELTEVVFKGIDGETVTGTLQWKKGDRVPTVDTKKAAWEFVPAASYNDKYATAEGELTISVVPATPEVDTLPTVNAITYHPDTKLADIALSGGKMNGIAGELTGTWAWKDATICPKAGDNTYVAVFTPEDSTNYKTIEVDITVSVAKATPYSKTAVAADAITYGEALKDSALSGGKVQYSEIDETVVAGTWSWKEETTKPVAADSETTQYDVVFTPTDAENYNKVETKITLIVNKAETAPNMPESTMNVLYSKKTVSAVKLPEGWVWNEADSTKELTVDVAVEATAIYNGADKGNYVTESVTISITRQACDHEESDILYTGEGEKAPTCTVDGIGHTECTKCQEPMQTNVIVKATGHIGETEVKDAKKATCAVDGYTGDTYCKDCGAKIATGTKIAKTTNHAWDGGVVTKQPTATEKGEKTYTCSVCKTTKKEEIPALGAPKKGAVAKSGKATYKVTKSDLKNGTAAYVGPLDKKATKVKIPATVKIDGVTFKVTSIEKNAFKNNKKLKTVTIGKNVTTIGDNAFYKCTALTKISIPSKVKTIGKNAFYGCKKMTSATIGKSVSKIGAKAFYGCSKLKTLKIKTTKLTTKKIGSKAFSKTPKSMKVTIPKKKFKTYKSMLIKKGVNKKAKFKKS